MSVMTDTVVWMSVITRRMYKWVVARHLHGWVLSCLAMSDDTHSCKCRIHKCVCGNTGSYMYCVITLIHMTHSYVTHLYMWHDSFICVTWLIHMCDMTHSYVWHVTHLYMWHDSFICVTWLIHMCDMWRIPTCDMTHSYAGHDSFIHMSLMTCVSCDKTHSYMCLS